MGILQSAIAYCHKAGFEVRAGNQSRGLVIVIPGAQVTSTADGVQFGCAPDVPEVAEAGQGG